MNFHHSDLTRAGWLLTLAPVGITLSLITVSLALFPAVLAAGRVAAMIVAAPSLLIGIAFFAIGAMVLKAIGFPVVRDGAKSEPLVSTIMRKIGADSGDDEVGRPFSQEEYETNASAGSAWDTRQAVRKAQWLTSTGNVAEAIAVLSALRGTIGEDSERAQLEALIGELQDLKNRSDQPQTSLQSAIQERRLQ